MDSKSARKKRMSNIQKRIMKSLESIVDEPIAHDVVQALRDGVFQVEYGVMDDSFMHPWKKGRNFRDNRTIIRKPKPTETGQIYVRYNNKKREHPFAQQDSNTFTAGVNYFLQAIERIEGPVAYVDLNFSLINSRLRLSEGTQVFQGMFTELDDSWEYPNSIRELMLLGCPVENLALKPAVRTYWPGEKVKQIALDTLENVYATGLDLEYVNCPQLRKLHVSTIKPQVLSPVLEELYILGEAQGPLDLSQLPLKDFQLFNVKDLTGWKLPKKQPREYISMGLPLEALQRSRRDLPLGIQRYLAESDRQRGTDFLDSLNGMKDPNIRIPVPVYYFDAMPKEQASLESQLVRLFPNGVDVLDSILPKLNISLDEIEKVTDRTYSGVVFSFLVRDEEDRYVRVYAKAGTREIVQREAQYLTDAWTHPLLRPIISKCAGVLETEKGTVLLTYEANEPTQVNKKEMCAYETLRNKAIITYARQSGLDEQTIKEDPIIVDAFNRALLHRETRQSIDKPEFRKKRILTTPFDMIVERATKTTVEGLFDELQRSRYFYDEALKVIEAYEPQRIVLTHGDAWNENILKNPRRTLIDFGCTQPDLLEWDLATSESKIVKPYVFFTQYLGDETQYNLRRMEEGVSAAGIILNARYLSSKLQRNCIPEAYQSARQLRRRIQLQVSC